MCTPTQWLVPLNGFSNGTSLPAYLKQRRWWWDWIDWWNEFLEKLKNLKKTCPIASSPCSNSKWKDWVSKSGPCARRPVCHLHLHVQSWTTLTQHTFKLFPVEVKLSLYRTWRPLGLREVEAPKFLDIRLTDGGKVVSPTRWPPFTSRKILGTHFR
jgi:hypothetical protein